MGPMPDHRWRGTELSFQQPDGNFGRYVDLRGPQGAGGLASGGAGMTRTQALQLNTLLAIFGGWIGTAPTVAIDALAIDGLEVTAEGSANGFYAGIPGGAPVEAAYEWDWGDGETSNTLDAVHAYAAAGTYTVSFRARNHIGWSEPVASDVDVTDSDPVVTDPNIKVLITGRLGADGDVTYTDELGHVWTAGGDAALEPTGAMYPLLSLSVPNLSVPTHWGLDAPANSAFQLGAGDFAVEVWVDQTSELAIYIDHAGEYGAPGWRIGTRGSGLLHWYSAVAGFFEVVVPEIQGSGPRYFRFERIDGTLFIYDGTDVMDSFPDPANYNQPATRTTIGRSADATGAPEGWRPFSGLVGGVQITVGGNRGGAGADLPSIPSPYDFLA